MTRTSGLSERHIGCRYRSFLLKIKSGPSGPFLFGPAKEAVRNSVLPDQAPSHRPVAFPVSSGVDVTLKGLEEPLLRIHLIDHADMTDPAQGLVVNRKHIRIPDRDEPYSLLLPGPGLSRSVNSREDRAAFLEQVYYCVATPRLTRDATSIPDNRIHPRPSVVYRAFTRSN